MNRSAFWTYSGIWVLESDNAYLLLPCDYDLPWDNGTVSLTLYNADVSFTNIDFNLTYGDRR